MDLRKTALIATWICFWIASLALLIANIFGLPLNVESGYSKTGSILITIGIIPNMCGLFLDYANFCFWLETSRLPAPCCMMQAGFVCSSAIFWIIGIYANDSMKIGVWLMVVSNLIKFVPQISLYYIQRPTQAPQLSQSRPDLLVNQPPTALTPNFEDVEQPPPSYEEYMAQRNDLPPKYEDLEEAPPAYQETML